MSMHADKSSIAFIFALLWANSVTAAERELVEIKAPFHDPLYVDKSSIRSNGDSISFNYVIDVPMAGPSGFNSNEVEASIDCARDTFVSGRVTAYAGARASGRTIGGYVSATPQRAIERISPQSTFAYLAEFVCAL
jgi:hypothetical protein